MPGELGLGRRVRLSLASATSGSPNLSEMLATDDLQVTVDQGMENVESAEAKVGEWWNGLTPSEQRNPVHQARYDAANLLVGLGYRLLGGEGINLAIRYYNGLVDVYIDDSTPGRFNRSVCFLVGIPIGGGSVQ